MRSKANPRGRIRTMARRSKRQLEEEEEEEEEQGEAEEQEEEAEEAEDAMSATESGPDDDDFDEMAVVGDYKHGSIRRMKLHNFLTYSDVEFYPGPRLNMVVGPNGTGKSTLLCAICLGLGGEPRLLGRASDIETFIMNGKEQAEIELEIATNKRTRFHKGGSHGNIQNIVVRRVIRKKTTTDGSPTKLPKSSFFVMDQGVSAKVIREMVFEDFSISIDNLCTFLPQDRVGSFSGFDAKALLVETEKSISAEMFDDHQKLIKDQELLNSGSGAVEGLKEKLARLKMDQQRLERERQRMEERELAEKQVELIKKKMMWLEFDEARSACVEKQQERSELKGQMKEVEKEMQPLQEAHQAAAERSQAANLRYGTLDKGIQDSQKAISKQRSKYESHDDEIEMISADLNSMESKKAALVNQIEGHRKKVQEITDQMAESPSIETLESEWKEAIDAKQKGMPAYQEAKRDVRNLSEEYRTHQEHYQRAKSRLTGLNDEKARRRDRILSQQPVLKKICDWLDQNRGKFRRQIWGPIALEVQTATRYAADCVEHHVPTHVLKTFIVQDKDDYNLLYETVRVQMNMPINIIVVKNGELRPVERQYSKQKMNILNREHGIEGFMDEVITAPDAVLQALISTSAIHKVLLGSQKTQVSLDEHNLLGFLSQPERGQTGLQSCCLFSTDGKKASRYLVNKSRYANTTTTRVDSLRPAKWLAPGEDDDMKERIAAELETAKGNLQDLKTRLETAQEDHDRLRDEAQQLGERANELKKMRATVTKYGSKLSNAKRKLAEAEDALAADDRREKNERLVTLKNRVSGSIRALELHAESHSRMMESTFQCAGMSINRDKLTANERHFRELHREKSEEYEGVKKKLEKVHNEFRRMKDNVRRLKVEAEAKAPICDENNNALPLKAELEDLPIDNCVAAGAALEEAQQKVDQVDADPNVIRQYNKVMHDIGQLEDEVEERTTGRAALQTDIDSLCKVWETKLEATVGKVDTLFGKYMGELGCTGEIRLAKSEADDGAPGLFQDWGIEIRVSFREGVKAQVLSARVQSGGERSVSTIMYLMALQEMMVAPFRCVDEINQGLDDRNERLVFKRIVANSTLPPGENPTDHCGQYFLITPKLLPNLYDMEVEALTVLSIFNGPFNFRSPLDWNVNAICSLRAAEGGANEEPPEPAQKRPRSEADV